MPGKSKAYADEYESDDFEHTDTLIGRNRVPVNHTKKKKTRPTSATKNKIPRRPVTPGKKKRAQSAPSARTGHELWMTAVKNRQTVGLSSNRHPQSPRHKTASEYWMETLRRTGQGANALFINGFKKWLIQRCRKAYLWRKGLMQAIVLGVIAERNLPLSMVQVLIDLAKELAKDIKALQNLSISTESTGMNTFNGKRPRDRDMPYLSTPSYLRQMVGTEKSGRGSDPTARPAPGTPNYKSQEEYYEQILEYKKQVSSMNQETSNMRAKIRRLEEDNLKKEKEIDALLNPHKSEEVRRTMADKRPDSGTMVHSLKQKILKLETQLREKEASYIKLQSDLKTTKIEELKQQLEVFYQEIVRLQHSRETGMDKSARGISKDGTVKIKALNETILRLNKSNEVLQNENRGLKEDLKNSMEGSISKDYEDMNRRDLLRTISQLERKAEKAERYVDGSSIVSYDTKTPHAQGKIALDGNLEDRLDQLDKRESELLAIVEKKNDKIRQLTDERNRWKRRCEDIEHMLTTGQIDHHERITDAKIEKSRQKSPSIASRPPSSRPLSARRDRDRPVSARSESERPISARDRSGSRSERPLSGRSERSTRPPSASRRRSSIDSGVSSVRRKKIQDFKENRSAKTIQRNWRSHQHKRRVDNDQKVQNFRENLAAKRIQKNWTGYQYRKHENERDEASDLIRSSLLGHKVRRQQMQHQFSEDDDDMMTEDEEVNECFNLIQSAMMGHTARKTRMREYQFSSTGEDDYDDDDSDIIGTPKRNLSSSIRSNRSQAGRSRSSISSVKGSSIRSGTTYNKAHSSAYMDDDDDDF